MSVPIKWIATGLETNQENSPQTSVLVNRGGVGVGDEASSAAGFIHANGADGDSLVRFESAL